MADSHNLMVVLAHLQGVAATFRVGRHHHRGPLHEGRGLTHALTDDAPTDLTVAAALVRKAYSRRRRSRLWSKPVNLRTWGLVSDPIAMVQAFAELRYGVVAHTLENSMKYGHNLGHTPYSLLPGPSGYRNPVVRGAWYSILLPRTLCVHHEEHYYPSFSSLKLKSSP